MAQLGPRGWLKWLRERTSPFLCPVCASRIDLFVPLFENLRCLQEAGYDLVKRQIQTLHWNAYSCPKCGGTDRDRLMALFLNANARDLGRSTRLLDIAPSAPLSAHIRAAYPGLEYRTADLHLRGVDDRVDMGSMGIYEDGRFDRVLCSHVLEHVDDDRKALSELHRILRPGGWALVLVPIDSSLSDVLEHEPAADAATRWRLYGQGDHVRMYSHDGLVTRLAETGFQVSVLTAAELGEQGFYRAGISLTSALYVASKAGSQGDPHSARP